MATAVVVLGAGCLESLDSQRVSSPTPRAWTPEPCDPSGARLIGANAPLLPAFQGPAYRVADRLAEAFDDDLSSMRPERSFDDYTEWSTREGRIQHHFPESAPSHEWRYSTNRAWPSPDPETAEAAMRSSVSELGVSSMQDVAVEFYASGSLTYGSVVQSFAGTELTGTRWHVTVNPDNSGSPTGEYSSLYSVGIRDLSRARVIVSEAEAEATAREYDRCVLDRLGKTEAAGYAFSGTSRTGLDVRNDSLVRTVWIGYTEPDESHCGLMHIVFVDAVTGAVHGFDHPPCD